MSDDQTVITLPDKQTLLRRLRSVSDELNVLFSFYPKLLRSAGKEMTLQEIATMLTVAMSDYTQCMPERLSDTVHERSAAYIEALVTDKTAAHRVYKLMQATLTV